MKDINMPSQVCGTTRMNGRDKSKYSYLVCKLWPVNPLKFEFHLSLAIQ